MFRSFASFVLFTLCATLLWSTVISGSISIEAGKLNSKQNAASSIKQQMEEYLSEINCGRCGNFDQAPCSQDVNDTCEYWPFSISIEQTIEPTCDKNPTCPPGLTCNPFWVWTEYNEKGTKESGVCDKYLTVNTCAKGLPLDAMPDYEVIIKNGKVYWKSTDTPVNTWDIGEDPGTLYVIDARDEKIYMVNVHNRRFMEVRGSANCLDRKVAQGESTFNCTVPRICNHAGIIMSSLATETPHDRFHVTLIGVGMVKVIDGEIQWISNESGHFKPPQDILVNVVDLLRKAGIRSFDHCLYKFEVHHRKKWLFVQHKCEPPKKKKKNKK